MTILLVVWLKPQMAPSAERERELLITTRQGRIWPIGILIVIVLGGLYSGIVTPTEIGGIGAFAALVIAISLGRMTRLGFSSAISRTLRTTAMVMAIIVSAHMFGYFISFTRVTDAMLGWITERGVSPTSVMLLVVFAYIIMGMFMDQAAIIILTSPITTPLMVGLGFDPIWWGVIIVKTAEIGMVTPSMGMNIFVVSSAAGTNLSSGFVGVIPFIITEFIMLGLLLAFPQITLALVG